jgi:predicted Ser/Thr protein kinase
MAGAVQPTEPSDRARPDIEAVRTAFPQLEVLSLVGQGGMGMVFKARQPQLDRFVALKVLAPERTEDPRFAERFRREAQALARLNHPNILTIHDFGKAGPFYFLLMEFVDGTNLRQLLRARRLEPKEALAIVPPVCEALQFAHDHGIVHRDIKPENLLLDKDGRVKIADYGIARMLGAGGGTEGMAETQRAGTPQYMAPEQRERPQEADHRADIYSLGVVLYEMLTGELPGSRLEPPSARARGMRIDVRLDEVVLRALEREPERRYQTAAEVKAAVGTMPDTGANRNQGAEAAAPARLSRAAIVGACWAPFSLWAIVAAYRGPTGPTTLQRLLLKPFGLPADFDRQGSGPAWWQWLLMALLLLTGLAAPFGTTVMGWVAVSRIRRSAGRLYGLGLACADGLLFPLLALDGLIIWLTYSAINLGGRLLNARAGPVELDMVLAPAALLCLVVDLRIARRVWAALRRMHKTGR